MSDNLSGGTTASFNNTPQAVDDSYSAGEDAGIILFDVMANDRGGNAKSLWSIDDTSDDGFGDLVSKDVAGTSELSELGARIYLTSTGRIAYDTSVFNSLGFGQTVTDQFTYAIRLSNGTLSWATVNVTITGSNDGPIAVADTAAGTENQALTIDVLANDTDVDFGHVFTLLAASADAGKGVASVAGNQLSYDPGSDFDHLAAGATETVTLSYTMSDEHGAQSSSTVTVTITGTNDGPVAVADAASTDENASVAIDVLANDTDVDDGASFTLVSATTSLGGVSISDNKLLFDTGSDFDHLAAGETEAVTINYLMADEHGAQSSSTVTVTITGTNNAPVIGAGDFGGAVLEAEPVTIPAGATPVLVGSGASTTFATAQTINRADLRVATNANLGDDSDPAISVTGSINSATDQDAYMIQLEAGETITLDIDFGLGYGSVAYPGYLGSPGLDSYVSIFDAAGNLLNVNDDAPIGAGGSGSAYTQDSYLQFTAASAGAYYILVHDWQVGAMSQGPYTLQVSVDSQALALTDSGSFAFADLDLSDGHSVSVTPQDSAYLGTLTASVSNASTGDGSGDVRWDFSVANAAVQFLAEGEQLVQTYTVAVSDGQGGVDEELVTVTLTGTNDVPVISNALSIGEVVEDSVLSANGQISFADVDLADGHTVTAIAEQAGYVGSFSATLADPSAGDGSGQVGWVFSVDNSEIDQLAAGQRLLQRYTITITDDHGATTQQLVNVTITGTNDGPIAVVDTAAGTENQALTIDVLANDTDVDNGHVFTLLAASADAGKGVASVAGNQLAFDPGSDFDHLAAGTTETVTLSYTMTDQHGAQSSSTAVVTITGTNDGPVAVANSASTSEDAGVTINVLANDSDVDGDTLSLSQVPATSAMGATLSVINGQIHYNATAATQLQALNNGQTATDTFTYAVSDGQGGTSTASVSVLVNGVTDSGAVSDSFATSEDNRVYLDVLANDISPNGKTIVGLNGSSTFTGTTAQGAYIEIAQGKIFYNPQNASSLQALDTGQDVVDSFTYTMRDGNGNLSQATVQIDVAGFTEGTVIHSGVTATVNFNGTGTPLSYTEDNMTVQSLYDPGSAPHLHMQGTYLNNHSGCCSSPYEFRYFNPDNGDTTFSLDSLLNLGGTGLYTSSNGGSVTVSTTGVADFSNNILFDNVEWVRWYSDAGTQNIDNFTFTS